MSGPVFNLPNVLTLSRIAATPVFLVLLFAEAWYAQAAAFAVFTAASLTDLYDGRLARSGNRVTEFGRFMDPLADKILVTSALVALAMSRIVHAWLIVPVIVRDIVITALRMHALYRGRSMQTSRFAKWKTTVQLVSILVILALIGLRAAANHYAWDTASLLDGAALGGLANALMAVVLLLTVLSGFHYLFRTDQHSGNAL